MNSHLRLCGSVFPKFVLRGNLSKDVLQISGILALLFATSQNKFSVFSVWTQVTVWPPALKVKVLGKKIQKIENERRTMSLERQLHKGVCVCVCEVNIMKCFSPCKRVTYSRVLPGEFV